MYPFLVHKMVDPPHQIEVLLGLLTRPSKPYDIRGESYESLSCQLHETGSKPKNIASMSAYKTGRRAIMRFT